ncbi:MAG: hypothetical protein EAX89_01365 [Candidatus Lokiarchaeota archaeon]|nr:hypothetical protein [Candidatus Lokiarchaeota archaeon]
MVDIFFWIDGITASGVVIFGIIFGLFFIYKSRKTKANILFYLGLANLFAGLAFLGVFLDFLLVIFIHTNLDNTFGLVGILSYIWLPLAVITAIFIGEKLLIPKAKWYVVSLFIILGIVFEIIVITTPFDSFNFAYPAVLGEGLIDYNLNIFSLAGMLMAFFLLTVIVLLSTGFLIKAFQSTGILKKKFFLISMGSLCFCVFGLLEGLTIPGFTIIFVRIGYLSSFWLMYYGLKD